MTLIDLKQQKQNIFNALIAEIKAHPEYYLNFETVADVYQAQWIKDLPPWCQWYVSGLDDGAEEFELSICYADQQILFKPYEI